MEKKKVAFICVHNSCRSQIAEALGKHLARDVFESYSAGTETKHRLNQDAVRLMREICPFIGRAFDDNWGLEDPTGKSDEEFRFIIHQIEENILELKKSLILTI